MRRSFWATMIYLTVAPQVVCTKFLTHAPFLNGFPHFARQIEALELYFQDLMVRNFNT